MNNKKKNNKISIDKIILFLVTTKLYFYKILNNL